jgi:hypothetical protein
VQLLAAHAAAEVDHRHEVERSAPRARGRGRRGKTITSCLKYTYFLDKSD